MDAGWGNSTAAGVKTDFDGLPDESPRSIPFAHRLFAHLLRPVRSLWGYGLVGSAGCFPLDQRPFFRRKLWSYSCAALRSSARNAANLAVYRFSPYLLR